MAGKVGSANWGVLMVDGYDLLASKIKSFTHKVTAKQEATTGLGDSTEAMTPTGLVKLEVSQAGAFFDDSTTLMHAALAPVAGLSAIRTLCAAFAGNTIGKTFLGISGLYAQAYAVLASVGLLTKADVTYQVSGTLDRGVILNDAVSKAASWNTKTDGHSVDYTTDTSQRVIPITSASKAATCIVTTTVPHGLTSTQIAFIAGNTLAAPAINGEQVVTVTSTTTFTVPVNTAGSTGAGTGGTIVCSNTLSGGAGYQQVSAMAGFTGFVGKIRDAPDDVTYGDLLTFTNVTAAPAGERLTNVADTVVDRYLCFTGTCTGSGTITVFCGFSRG